MIRSWLRGKFGLSHEELEKSRQELEAAQAIEKRALAMSGESARLGAALRAIQHENHFGQSLTHAYRKA
ncbi:hypothetical protein SEA_ABBA_25 [Arthrobacter phage Abba]|uniref:Uncharacterized protein n=1 Tax=Arthrobacter phage Abba TaxID=2713256 RepID=A0A6G8R2D6_9CAUD|nr:hypothetical protein HYQ28_gp25 [Arthrobacter phage Abba]QIN94354.1 hypothetical protein SEA_ABBA_25 [Arthrobacter phage Abba]